MKKQIILGGNILDISEAHVRMFSSMYLRSTGLGFDLLLIMSGRVKKTFHSMLLLSALQ